MSDSNTNTYSYLKQKIEVSKKEGSLFEIKNQSGKFIKLMKEFLI